MGGTLRRTARRTRTEKYQLIERIMNLVGAQGSVNEFSRLLSRRAKAYKTLGGTDPYRTQRKRLVDEMDAARFSCRTDQRHCRSAQPDCIAKPPVCEWSFLKAAKWCLELFRRGYRLGLVSNTTSSVEVPALLKELEITGCFETVILSTVVGKRKPDPVHIARCNSTHGDRTGALCLHWRPH